MPIAITWLFVLSFMKLFAIVSTIGIKTSGGINEWQLCAKIAKIYVMSLNKKKI